MGGIGVSTIMAGIGVSIRVGTSMIEGSAIGPAA
jgi:hypothetical protein